MTDAAFQVWWDAPDDGPTPDGPLSKTTAEWIWRCALAADRAEVARLVRELQEANEAAGAVHLLTARQEYAWRALLAVCAAGRGGSGSSEGLVPAPRWWHCDTHGPGNRNAWGCPECVRELRTLAREQSVEIQTLRAELNEAITALPQAIRNERERCAKAREDEARLWEQDGEPATEARLCAARIRCGPNVRGKA